MSFVPSSRRAAAMALACAVLCGACIHRASAADATAPGNAAASQPKTPLAPEVEAKLKELTDKAKETKEKIWEVRMEKEIQDIVKVTGLDADHSKALEAAAKQAADSGVDSWGDKMTDQMRTQFATVSTAQALQALTAELPQAASFAQGGWGMPATTIKEPYEQDDWIKAVHQILSADQAALWDKTQAAQKDKIEKEISGLLKAGGDRTHEMQMQQILAQCAEIEQALSLPKDRADKLEALGKTVVDQTTEMWRKRVGDMLASMEEPQRLQYTQSGANVYFGPEKNEMPTEQAAWKDGVAGILTADEVARLQSAKDARKLKRVQIMGQIMVMVVDEKIAFTDAQRRKFEPIAERLVKDVPELFPEYQENMYYAFPPSLFLTAAAKATPAEMKSILDDVQSKRWKDIAQPDPPADAGADDKSKPDAIVEPEDVERAISNYLYMKTEAERKTSLAENVLKAEDAVRTTGIGAEAAERLQTAARGATEQYLTGWKWMMDQQIRGQLQGLTPQNVKQRLDGMQNMFFQRNMGMNMNQNPGANVWDETVKVTLTPQQQQAWQKEIDARTAFRDQASAAIVMEEFDLKNHLTDDQWVKLQPIIAKIIRDYTPDIERMFSMGNNTPWFMSNQFDSLPFAGVPDTDLKAIFTKQQMALWTGSQEYTNANSWWQNVEQMHKQRVPK
jgi:hypothetical protein